MNKIINQNIALIDSYFRKSGDDSEKERLLSRVVKLNEEVGELCEAVLHENDTHQRNKEKEIDLDSELADVLICTLLIAHSRDKDIWEQVNQKLEKQLVKFNIT